MLDDLDPNDMSHVGKRLHDFASELYPICRSITGNGLRQTLELIGKRIPLQVSEVSTGTDVFDWTIPKEWNIRDAYIVDSSGRRVVDFQQSNLHVMSCSAPVHGTLPLQELQQHIHTLPDHPDWIPYRTSYYNREWGFCMAHNRMLKLSEAQYDICIDSTFEDGHLSYGECYLPGSSSDEVLISTHVCHPSLANDNLSGVTVAAFLAQMLSGRSRRYSYRFLFIPGTIGAITWLARNRQKAQQVKHGLVLTCLGDAGGFHYKKSRRGNAEIDRAAAHVLSHCGEPSNVMEFSPYGYDERQYCSPGFNLPVGCLMRSVWGTFPEYHTSADNLDFIRPEQLARSLQLCASIVEVLEENQYYMNLNPFCEPQLGKRNLYRSSGGESIGAEINTRLWVLNLSDGNNSLLDIAERSNIPFRSVVNAAQVLLEAGLLQQVPAAVAEIY